MFNKTNYIWLLVLLILFLNGCNYNNPPQLNTNNIVSITNIVDKQTNENLDNKLEKLIDLAYFYKGKETDLLKGNMINLGGTNGYIVIHTPSLTVTLDALENIQKYKDYNLDSAKNKYNEVKDNLTIYGFLYSNESDFMKNPTTVIKIDNKIIHSINSSGEQFADTSNYFPNPAYIGGCISHFNISDLGDTKKFQFIIINNGVETNFIVDLSKLIFNEF